MQPLHTKETDVYLASNLADDLSCLIEPYHPEKVFVLVDENSHNHCFPLIRGVAGIDPGKCIVIGAGESYKNVETLARVWDALVSGGATRHSLLVNLGGGMPCDLGGFAASTFKRGISFLNVPTTLLAQVDASVGGKTGINFKGYKNEIGSFMQPAKVLVDTRLLQTLDSENMRSGFAEMIKHGYLKGEETLNRVLRFDITNPSIEELTPLVVESIRIKDYFVTADPLEKDIRKALNLGHTVGHALESASLEKGTPVLHGYAVAHGMVAELYLAHMKLGFPLEMVTRLAEIVKSIYGIDILSDHDHDALFAAMLHDKKNQGGRVNFTLLKAPGEVAINIDCKRGEVKEALQFLGHHL